MVDALLFFARNDIKNPEVKDISAFLQSSLRREGSRVSFVEESGLKIPIYPELFLTAVENIVSNAEKFTPPEGKITITTSHAGVTISDTGMGIPKSHLPYIFDRLYKVDKARTHTSGQ